MADDIEFKVPKSAEKEVAELAEKWEKLKKEVIDSKKLSTKMRALFSSKKAATSKKSVELDRKTNIEKFRNDLSYNYITYYDDEKIKDRCKKYLDDIHSFCVKQKISLSKENLLGGKNYKYGINRRVAVICELLDDCNKLFKKFKIDETLIKKFNETKVNYESAVKEATNYGIKLDKECKGLKEQFDSLSDDYNRFMQFSDKVKEIAKERDQLKNDCNGVSEWPAIFIKLNALFTRTKKLKEELIMISEKLKNYEEISQALHAKWTKLQNKINFAAKLKNLVVFDNNMGLSAQNAFKTLNELKTEYGTHIQCASQNALLIAQGQTSTKMQYNHAEGDTKWMCFRLVSCKGPYYVLVNGKKEIEKEAYVGGTLSKTINSSSVSPSAETEVDEYLRKALQAGEWKHKY